MSDRIAKLIERLRDMEYNIRFSRSELKDIFAAAEILEQVFVILPEKIEIPPHTDS